MPVFEALPQELSHVLSLIHNRNLALPDFQRDFVWDPSAVEDLVSSVALNYPAGSLLFLRQGGEPYFEMRHSEGAPPLNGYISPHLVLDGQQRLTALYQAFYGTGEHLYYLNLQNLLQDGDMESALEHYTRSRALRTYGRIEDQVTDLILPLRVIHGEQNGFLTWRDAVLDSIEETEQRRGIRDALNEAYERWIKNIEQYKFPVVTLPPETGLEAVCKIFETLNRTGVRLGVFELLTARFYPAGIKLRELWEAARTSNPILTEYEIDPYYILQTVALLSGAPTCKQKDVLNLKADAIDSYWSKAVQGLSAGLDLLRADCGVLTASWVPYFPMLLPLGGICTKLQELNGPARGAARAKVIRWFWCSTFAQAYEQGANSQAQSDYNDLQKWIEGSPPPPSVSGFSFDFETLSDVTPRQRAMYRGAMALMLRRGTRDFHTLEQLNAASLRERRVSDHHVFPQAYLQANWPNTSQNARDCILNRALIDPITNSRIGARPPSQYLADIEAELGSEQLKSVLESHLLPSDSASSLTTDNFELFSEERKQRLRREISEVTGFHAAE